MTGRTKQGSLWRRAMFESAATEFVLQLDCRALHGFVFRVVKRIGYFVPQLGRPPRSSPGNSFNIAVMARARG